MEVGPHQRLALSLVQVADGTEAVAAALAETRARVEPALEDHGGAGVQTYGARFPAFAVEHANAAIGQFEVL